jgi:hypothetical protein
MRACDIDTAGPVWLYRPAQHKTAWRGKARVVALGPRAQAVVKLFLPLDTQAHLFSPARALAERAAVLRANRKTRVQPSQQNRRKRDPKRAPRDFYAVSAYEHAIARGCDKADRLARQDAENAQAEAEGREPARVPAEVRDVDRLIPRWGPNRLRHNHGTEVRRRFALEAAGAVLGHAELRTSQVYAERDESIACRVAAEVG